MVEFKILSVRNPQWASEDGSAIDCLIRTNTHVGELPFTARRDDPEPHGREIYARCRSGEFGEIAAMEVRERPSQPAKALPEKYRRLEGFLQEANLANAQRSSRSVVIVWGSKLDNLLDQMLEEHAMRAKRAGQSVKRPPKTFSRRIYAVAWQGLISADEARKCHHIRKIRNAAAHEWDFTLDQQDVLPSLQALFDEDHSNAVVFHEDLEFLVQQVYSSSAARLMMKFVDRLG